MLPKVANERYCNIVLIFGVGIAGTSNRLRRWQIFFLNNSALGDHRAVPKVVNERYCNIVLIFCFFICVDAPVHAVHACKRLVIVKMVDFTRFSTTAAQVFPVMKTYVEIHFCYYLGQ